MREPTIHEICSDLQDTILSIRAEYGPTPTATGHYRASTRELTEIVTNELVEWLDTIPMVDMDTPIVEFVDKLVHEITDFVDSNVEDWSMDNTVGYDSLDEITNDILDVVDPWKRLVGA